MRYMSKRDLREAFEDLFPPITYRLSRSIVKGLRPSIRDQESRERELLAKLEEEDVIIDGPFAGMKYSTVGSISGTLPKLVGTYECELHREIERALESKPDLIVNIGAAEGYYAVGCALRVPDARIVASDQRASCRYFVKKLADLNSVSVTRLGRLTADKVIEILNGSDKSLVICDIEGGEGDLLTSEVIGSKGGQASTFVVEVHDHFVSGVGDRLIDRFDATHTVERVTMDYGLRQRPPCMDAGDWAEFIDEKRQNGSWVLARPKNAAVG